MVERGLVRVVVSEKLVGFGGFVGGFDGLLVFD